MELSKPRIAYYNSGDFKRLMIDTLQKDDAKFIKVSMLQAILELVPNAKCAIEGNDLSTLVWDETNESSVPSDEAIEEKYKELETLWETTEEPRVDRKIAYPEIEEQLDKLFHDIDTGKLDKTGEFYKAIKAVKDANPKG